MQNACSTRESAVLSRQPQPTGAHLNKVQVKQIAAKLCNNCPYVSNRRNLLYNVTNAMDVWGFLLALVPFAQLRFEPEIALHKLGALALA